MEKVYLNVWPDSVPTSLWDYERAMAGTANQRIFPMSGSSFSGEFLLYFLIGVVIVWLYAWNRFNRRSYEPAPFDYRVLRELQPAQMRDALLMQRAFVLYALALTLTYATFTFFGGIILKITSSLPAVGPIDVNADALKSPQWPLMVALGLAGLTQLITPLDHLEKSLRSHVHRSLGIPIRIKEYTRLLIAVQLSQIAQEAQGPAAQGRQSGDATAGLVLPATIEAHISQISRLRINRLADWARNEIAQTYGLEDVLGKTVLLWRMIDGLRSPSWPQEGVRDELRPLVSRQLQEATATARYLSDLLESPLHRDEGSASHSADPNDVKKVEDPADGQSEGAAEPQAADATPTPHRTRQEQQLITAIESMERHLYEIGAIYAVYAQRDRNYKTITDPGLRRAVVELFQDEGYGPSVRQIACGAAVLFIGYFAALHWTSQGLMGQMPFNFWTIGISAIYETVRTLCIFVFPTLFAIYMTMPERSHARPPGSAAGNVMAAFLWGALAAFLLMGMLALVYTWLVARNGDHFTELLLGQIRDTGFLPNLPYFQTFVPVAAITAGAVVMARLPEKDSQHFTGMALVAVLAALLAKLHIILVISPRDCTASTVPECLAVNFADSMAAAIAVLFLCQHRDSGRVSGRFPELVMGSAAAVLLILTPLAASPAHAQTTPLAQPAAIAPGDAQRARKPVVLGFRADAQPFSYLNSAAGVSRFQGYIADLCYEIFAGSTYDVFSFEVTATDRFHRVRGYDAAAFDPASPPASPLVDVLCDPLTLRYEDPERWRNGIFSPVVFATSITYLHLGASLEGDQLVQLGYVRNTTAETVARDMCKSVSAKKGKCLTPMFRARIFCSNPTREKLPKKDDKTGVPLVRFLAKLAKSKTASESRPPRYALCPQSSHYDLVDWFCRTAPTARTRLYFGDRELILAKLKEWKDRNGPCDAKDSGAFFSYEPYALLVTKTDPDLVQFVQRRIYQIFSDTSKVRGLFTASFGEYQMSSSLAYLFLLNGVGEERNTARPDCGALSGSPAADGCKAGYVQDGPLPEAARQ